MIVWVWNSFPHGERWLDVDKFWEEVFWLWYLGLFGVVGMWISWENENFWLVGERIWLGFWMVYDRVGDLWI